MKLVLISSHVKRSIYSVPLGAASIAAAICEGNVDTSCALIEDFPEEQSLEQLTDRVISSGCDAAGFSLFVWNRRRLFELAREIRARAPEMILFAGGPEVTADLSGVEGSGLFDLLIPGEGEPAVPSLIPALGDIMLSGRLQAEAMVLEQTESSLSALPSPWLTGPLKTSDYSGILWELARGCPFRCTFCYESRGSSCVRHFPDDRIRQELELFVREGVEHLFVLDPTFNYNLKRSKQLLHLFREVAPDIHYSFEARAEFIDEELAALMGELHCSLQIGLQSADPSVLEKLQRRFDPRLFQEHLLILHRAGVVYGLDLIYGLPGDTESGFYRSLNFALALRPNHIDLFPLSVLPGTVLAEDASGFDLCWEKEAPYSLISSPGFTPDQMERSASVALAVDLVYNKCVGVTWFSLVTDSFGCDPADFFKMASESKSLMEVAGEPSLSPPLIEAVAEVVKQIAGSLGQAAAGELAADLVRWYSFLSLMEREDADISQPFKLHFPPESWIPHVEAGLEELNELLPWLSARPATGQIELTDEGIWFTPSD